MSSLEPATHTYAPWLLRLKNPEAGVVSFCSIMIQHERNISSFQQLARHDQKSLSSFAAGSFLTAGKKTQACLIMGF
jgi:hypothetical protein